MFFGYIERDFSRESQSFSSFGQEFGDMGNHPVDPLPKDGLVLRSTVCAVHRERLNVIDREDYTGVARKVREELLALGREVTDDYLNRGIQALKQYYAVALLDPANAHAISAEVDPFWHAHILHSKEYMAFCNKVIGEYMHHVPLDRTNAAQMANIRRLYDYTIEILDKLFERVDREFWPTKASDAELICFHRGNNDLYQEVQPFRLFEPSVRGLAESFA